jgi:hypothetical protein
MKTVDAHRFQLIQHHQQIILKLQSEIAERVVDYNLQAKELYDQLVGNDVATLNAHIETLNEARSEIHAEMEGYFEAQPAEWQRSEDGKRYLDWMGGWDNEIDMCEVGDFEEIDEIEDSDLLVGSDFSFSETPDVETWPSEQSVSNICAKCGLVRPDNQVTGAHQLPNDTTCFGEEK